MTKTENATGFFEKRDDCEIWLNSNEAAFYLRMSVNALRIHVFRGHIPAYKIGRRLRFKLRELALLPKLEAPRPRAFSKGRKKNNGY